MRALGDEGHEIGGFQAAFAGDVPLASGLSSSAAIEAATAPALGRPLRVGSGQEAVSRALPEGRERVRRGQSGIMDQYASLLCEAGLPCSWTAARCRPRAYPWISNWPA